MSDKQPKLAFDLQRDLRALSAMASSLTPYLYENGMYGPLANDLPRLTIGGLLLRLYRLNRLTSILNAEQQAAVKQAQAAFEAERARWAVHYNEKLQRELQSRLDALSGFLRECSEDWRACAASYPSQAEKRTMIEHLHREAEDRGLVTNAHLARLKDVDQKLKRMLKEGDLITDERLAGVYPRDEFWWLYRFVPESES